MDYEEYYKRLEYSEEIIYENGFCPFTRKPCMGTDCQLSVNYKAEFAGCQLAEWGRRTCN